MLLGKDARARGGGGKPLGHILGKAQPPRRQAVIFMDSGDAQLLQPPLMPQRKGDGDIRPFCVLGRIDQSRGMARRAQMIAVGPGFRQIGVAGQDDGDVQREGILFCSVDCAAVVSINGSNEASFASHL